MHPKSNPTALSLGLLLTASAALAAPPELASSATPASQTTQTIRATTIQAAEPRLAFMAGTAFAVSKQGHLITADHAIRSAS